MKMKLLMKLVLLLFIIANYFVLFQFKIFAISDTSNVVADTVVADTNITSNTNIRNNNVINENVTNNNTNNNTNNAITSSVVDTTSSTKQNNGKQLYVPLSKSVTGAIVRTLIFPGLGQLYTNSYIKAPLFGIAAGSLWYLTISNHTQYKDFQSQLNLIEDKNSSQAIILKNRREIAIDNRDMSALYLIGVYVISLVDAYSSVHLFDFDVSNFSSVNTSGFRISISPIFFPSGELFWTCGIRYRF